MANPEKIQPATPEETKHRLKIARKIGNQEGAAIVLVFVFMPKGIWWCSSFGFDHERTVFAKAMLDSTFKHIQNFLLSFTKKPN